MNRIFKISKLFLVFSLTTQVIRLQAQNMGEIHGNMQLDAQLYRADSVINAQKVSEKVLSNAFANLIYTNQNFTAGVRYEAYLNPMLTFENYEGQGISYRYAQYQLEKLNVTIGNYYEQFGSGLIFRSYEARNLGYDNMMDGVRLIFTPKKGIYLKGIIGKQRIFWDNGPGIVRGFDSEIRLNDLFSAWEEKKTKIIVGGSFISKFQEDLNDDLNLPENVGAYALRGNITKGKVSVKAEYAYKINDPSSDNRYIYKPGQAFYLTSNYSKKGFGVLFETKILDNMSYRSDRDAGQNNLMINYLPATTRQHTYNLAATLYPYATRPQGEMGIQLSVFKKFEKETALGGKYGTQIDINYSNVRSQNEIEKNDVNLEPSSKRYGYVTSFGIGSEKYFRDFNIEIKKKFSSKLKATFSYVSLLYNMEIVQGLGGTGTIKSNILISDITWKIKPKNTLRIEAQGLVTGDMLEIDLANKEVNAFKLDNTQDQGHWAMGLLEYTYSPHWSISVMDQYNIGNSVLAKRAHYWLFAFAYLNKSNRYALNIGRQRAGLLCVGGVCRNVPAANGVTLSITSSF